jgi:hypothetical protein
MWCDELTRDQEAIATAQKWLLREHLDAPFELRKEGFLIESIPRDGDCFFRALYCLLFEYVPPPFFLA